MLLVSMFQRVIVMVSFIFSTETSVNLHKTFPTLFLGGVALNWLVMRKRWGAGLGAGWGAGFGCVGFKQNRSHF